MNDRISLQRHVSKLGKACTIVQQNELLERHCKLEARITAYGNRISVLIKSNDNTMWLTPDNNMSDTTVDPSDAPSNESPDGWYIPEDEWITLPSSFAAGEVEHLTLEPIAMIETSLRKGKISYAVQIPSRQQVMLGTMYINWMRRLGHSNIHINWLRMCCNAWKQTLNIWPHFMILPIMI